MSAIMPITQDVDTSAAPKQPKRRRLKTRDWAPYAFVSPFFVIFGTFGLFPLLFAVYLSFHTWDPAMGMGAMNWVGFENYEYILLSDDYFWKAMYNTFWLGIVSGLPQHLVGLPLAYLLHTVFGRMRNSVVGMYFLPFITSTVAISLVFTTLFSKDFGAINQLLVSMSKTPIIGWIFPAEKIDWSQPEYLKPMISFVVWWRYLGWNTVMYLAALQTISKDLFEAATMDGATRTQQFRHITLPLLKPMMFMTITFTIIGNIQLFEEPFIITGSTGGINQAGLTVAMHMYRTAFTDNDFGTAAAIAWLVFALIVVMTIINNKLLASKD